MAFSDLTKTHADYIAESGATGHFGEALTYYSYDGDALIEILESVEAVIFEDSPIDDESIGSFQSVPSDDGIPKALTVWIPKSALTTARAKGDRIRRANNVEYRLMSVLRGNDPGMWVLYFAR